MSVKATCKPLVELAYHSNSTLCYPLLDNSKFSLTFTRPLIYYRSDVSNIFTVMNCITFLPTTTNSIEN
jgi:hypothetical protein